MDLEKLYNLIFLSFCENWGEKSKEKYIPYISRRHRETSKYGEQESSRKFNYSIVNRGFLLHNIVILLVAVVLFALIIGKKISIDYGMKICGIIVAGAIFLMILRENRFKLNHACAISSIQRDWEESELILKSRADDVQEIISSKVKEEYDRKVLIDFMLEKTTKQNESRKTNAFVTGWILPAIMFMLGMIENELIAMKFVLQSFILCFVVVQSIRNVLLNRDYSRFTNQQLYLNAFEDTLRYIKLQNKIDT